jgi:hypothetical protein
MSAGSLWNKAIGKWSGVTRSDCGLRPVSSILQHASFTLGIDFRVICDSFQRSEGFRQNEKSHVLLFVESKFISDRLDQTCLCLELGPISFLRDDRTPRTHLERTITPLALVRKSDL